MSYFSNHYLWKFTCCGFYEPLNTFYSLSFISLLLWRQPNTIAIFTWPLLGNSHARIYLWFWNMPFFFLFVCFVLFCFLLCFTLLYFPDISLFTNWRFVAILCQAVILVPFLQEHLLTFCLVLVVLQYFKLFHYYYICFFLNIFIGA